MGRGIRAKRGKRGSRALLSHLCARPISPIALRFLTPATQATFKLIMKTSQKQNFFHPLFGALFPGNVVAFRCSILECANFSKVISKTKSITS